MFPTSAIGKIFFPPLFFFFFYKHFCFILCIWVFCLHVLHYKQAFWRSEEHIDPLELELGTVMSYYISVRNQTQALWKKNQCSQPLSHLFSSKIISLVVLFPLFTFNTRIFPSKSFQHSVDLSHLLWNLGKSRCYYIGLFRWYVFNHWPQRKHHNTMFSRTLNKVFHFLQRKMWYHKWMTAWEELSKGLRQTLWEEIM